LVRVQVKSTSTTNLPQLIARHPRTCITTTTATATKTDGTWEELKVVFTPVVDCIVDIALYARDASGTAYFSDGKSESVGNGGFNTGTIYEAKPDASGIVLGEPGIRIG
jgi:hypothetical protein